MTSPPLERKPLWLLYAVSIVSMTGLFSFLPALPAMQRELNLSDAQTSLVVTTFLLPGVLMAFPAGLLADRYGRRVVLAGGLFVLGSGGVILTMFHSFSTVLVVRFFQGVGFATIAPLTITLIGDWFTGIRQVRAQAFRSVVMGTGTTVLPIVGGLMAGISWYAPFTLQVLGLLGAAAVWLLVPAESEVRSRLSVNLRGLVVLTKERIVIAVLVLAVIRFLLFFAFLAYFPILLGNEFGLSSAAIGLTIGMAALSGTVLAAFTSRLVTILRPSLLLALSFGLAGIGLGMIGLGRQVTLVITGGLVLGLSDGPVGVIHNSVMTQVAPAQIRASFVAATGAMKNLGKFLGPALTGLMLTVLSLSGAFVALGLSAFGATVATMEFRPVDELVAGSASERWQQTP